MPVVNVEIIRDSSQAQQPGLTTALAESLALIFGKEPERTWVRLHYLEPGHYAEGGGGPQPGVLPVFVTVLLARLPEMDQRQRLAADIAQALGELLDRNPKHVHVIFEPEATGRVAFGGKLVL